jgi:hypothetical protein
MSVTNTERIEELLADLQANGEGWQRKKATEALEELKFVRETAEKILARHPELGSDLRACLESFAGRTT